MSFIFRYSTQVLLVALVLIPSAFAADAIEYKVIATNRTSTTQKEMNEAADAGFRFGGVMGGDTAFGGSEVVTIMSRTSSGEKARFAYRLLATSKTSTMQKELQAAGDEGFEYKGQTVFKTAFGGPKVVVILEMDRSLKQRSQYDYKLLATKKTSTMQKELTEAGADGYEFVGVTVGQTAVGGAEVVSILRRQKPFMKTAMEGGRPRPARVIVPRAEFQLR